MSTENMSVFEDGFLQTVTNARADSTAALREVPTSTTLEVVGGADGTVISWTLKMCWPSAATATTGSKPTDEKPSNSDS